MARGCGSRVAGGIYIEVPMGPFGTPLPNFIVDPPLPVDPYLEIPNRGVAIRLRPGTDDVYDVFDRVGSMHYPNVLDFYKEGANMGFSRRISRGSNFALLDSRSYIFLIHERAIILNHEEFFEALRQEADEFLGASRFACPKCLKEHADFPYGDTRGGPFVSCAGLWWEDVMGGERDFDPHLPPRTVRRKIGDTEYRARHRPSGVDPFYQEGIFLRLPIHHLSVIRDKDGGHGKALDRATTSGLRVEVEDD